MDKNISRDELDPDVRWDEYLRTSPFQTPTPEIPIIAEYFRLVNTIFGAYLAITTSLNEVVQILERKQEESAEKGKITIEQLDKEFLLFGKIDPHKPSAYPEPGDALHMCSQGGFKKKNGPDGDNQVMAANMCLVMIYTYWEDHYREKISQVIGLKDKNEVKIEIMGDVRILRNSIVHHGGYVISDKKFKILTWFQPGDKININLDQFDEIKRQIEKGLSKLSQDLRMIST